MEVDRKDANQNSMDGVSSNLLTKLTNIEGIAFIDSFFGYNRRNKNTTDKTQTKEQHHEVHDRTASFS